MIPEALEGTNAAEGGRKIKPYHSFRNTVQTWWENNTEIAEKTRNAVTGHKTEGIVGRYIEVKKARMLEAIEMLPFKPVDDELVEAD